MSNPFFKAQSGDPLLSADWNEMQIKMREEIAQQIRTHDHSGVEKGTKLGGESILANVELEGLNIRGKRSLEFIAGNESETVDAGKIGYQLLGDGLDILGAGARADSRKLVFQAKGGSIHEGPLTISDTLEVEADIAAKRKMAVEGELTVKGTLKASRLITRSSLSVVEKLEAQSSLSVAGDINANKSLTVKDEFRGGKALSVNGEFTADGALTVAGDIHVDTAEIVVKGDRYANTDKAKTALTVDGPLTAKRSVTMEAELNLQSSLTLGSSLTINQSLTVEGDLSVGAFTINGTVTTKSLSFGEEAVRIVYGLVNADGTKSAGQGYSSKKTSDDKDTKDKVIEGIYAISFSSPFDAAPVVVATQLSAGSEPRDTRDNAVVLTSSTSGCKIKVGKNDGTGEARAFFFIAIG